MTEVVRQGFPRTCWCMTILITHFDGSHRMRHPSRALLRLKRKIDCFTIRQKHDRVYWDVKENRREATL